MVTLKSNITQFFHDLAPDVGPGQLSAVVAAFTLGVEFSLSEPEKAQKTMDRFGTEGMTPLTSVFLSTLLRVLEMEE